MTEPENQGWGPKSAGASRAEGWERDLLERLSFASLTEQRRARRWSIFFRFIFLAWLILFLVVLLSADYRTKPQASRYTALVELEGAIMVDSPANADNVISGLRAAFEDKGTAGVIVRANSPGGSAVQSAHINDEIRRLRAKHPKTPLYAVIGDMCASGCYYAVVAADKIYANEASLVGSIGVLLNSFGATEAMKKLGIERRLLTAGEHKGFLDPFSPLKPEEKRHALELLAQVHQQFIERVRAGRGAALKETKDMFSGLFWTGEEARAMGLIDEFGSASYVAREVIGAEEVVDFTYREGVLDRFARRFGATMAQALSAELSGRAPALK
jgi:protease IV